MLSDHARSIPIFWGHGLADPLVKYHLCQRSVSILKNECGFKELEDEDNDPIGIRCKTYQGMAHSACPEEMDDLRSWLKSVVPKENGRL
jgi:predicted esterase